MHQVAFNNFLNIIDIVLKHRWGDLERKSEKGRTVLHYTATRRNLLIVRKLVEAGADIEAKDN
jgi:ankyrin repeat protein